MLSLSLNLDSVGVSGMVSSSIVAADRFVAGEADLATRFEKLVRSLLVNELLLRTRCAFSVPEEFPVPSLSSFRSA